MTEDHKTNKMTNIFTTPTANYDAERNEFSFTFPTKEGMRSIRLLDGKLRQSRSFMQRGQVRYTYAYNPDSDLATREAFDEYISGKTEEAQRDAAFFGEHAERACRQLIGTEEAQSVQILPVANLKECSHIGYPLFCSEEGHEDVTLPLEEYIDHYATEHPDGFTVVVPWSGDLDEFVAKMLEGKPYKVKLLCRSPRRLRAAWMLYAIVQPGTEFSRHYADDFERAYKQIYDYFGVDPKNDERGNAGFERSRILDEEMRRVVATTMRNLKNHNLSDAAMLDEQDVLMVNDLVTEWSPINPFFSMQEDYDTRSATLVNIVYK